MRAARIRELVFCCSSETTPARSGLIGGALRALLRWGRARPGGPAQAARALLGPLQAESEASRRLRRTRRATAALIEVAAAQETARLSQAVLNQWLFSQPSVTM